MDLYDDLTKRRFETADWIREQAEESARVADFAGQALEIIEPDAPMRPTRNGPTAAPSEPVETTVEERVEWFPFGLSVRHRVTRVRPLRKRSTPRSRVEVTHETRQHGCGSTSLLALSTVDPVHERDVRRWYTPLSDEERFRRTRLRTVRMMYRAGATRSARRIAWRRMTQRFERNGWQS